MTNDLVKLMEYIDSLQSEQTPEIIVETETKIHPLLQAMQELKEEGVIESLDEQLVEAKVSIRDQIINDVKQDGGNIDDYYVRSSYVDKLGYSTKQTFGRSPDVDDPNFSVDYIGYGKGKPALWFYPLAYYLRTTKGGQSGAYANENPHIWLVKLKPNAWLQPVDNDNVTKQDAPDGKERVGILRLSTEPAAIFFKPGYQVVKKYYDYGRQHQRHGQVKGPPVEPKPKSMLDKIKGFFKETEEPIDEASPDTLEGSFTPDLVESKTWLANMLAKGLKGKNAGTIYVLGSWYGNMGIFLQQAGVNFDKLVLVEPDEEALLRSKELLDTLNDDGKLILIHQKAEDIVYEKPGVVINTSCNETGPVFLTKLPDNMLCLLQARNNNEDSLFPTEQLEDFVDYFPLEKVYYTGEKQLEDPEVNYTRFMKIGRSGKKPDEKEIDV